MKRYPTSKVRDSGRKCQTMTAQERPRVATPRPRSGAAAGRSYRTPPRLRPGAAAQRTYPTPKARGCGREEQTHLQKAVAALVQEGLEELSDIEDQERQC